MRYLFIDTSTQQLTIALSTENKILGLSTSDSMNEHSKYAISKMAEVFDETSLKPNEIDKIIVVNGPGSFTGVRIGVTIAKTYAWTLKKDVIPVSSLLVNALGYDGYDYYVSVIDARRNCVYAGIYDKQYNSVLKDQYININDLENIISSLKGTIIVIGNIDIDNYKFNHIKVDVLKIVNYCKDIKSVLPHSLNPNYLKRVEAEEKLMGVKE